MTNSTSIIEDIISPLLFGASTKPAIHHHPFVKGYIFNFRTSAEGLLIMVKDFGDRHSVPSNAPETTDGWLLIPSENKQLTTITILCWMRKIPVIAYCAGLKNGLAVINRITPLTKPNL